MWLSTIEASVLGIEEIAGIMRVDIRNGLWWQEAEHRKQLFGYNELSFREEEPTWKKYIEQFKNPLILLLLGSAVVSVSMKQFDDAISITVFDLWGTYYSLGVNVIVAGSVILCIFPI